MSSINPHPTFHYSQPDEYRFSHDSVFLARQVFELEGAAVAGKAMLDLCSGCGIVGLDFMFHCRSELGLAPQSFDFIDVQEAYLEHFARNSTTAGFANVRFIANNYSALLDSRAAESYDLILCNPPYFHVGKGKLSPSDFKNRCRFFIDADPATLMQAILHVLRPEGKAYVLIRSLDQVSAWLGDAGRSEVVGDIRGTPLLRISRRVQHV